METVIRRVLPELNADFLETMQKFSKKAQKLGLVPPSYVYKENVLVKENKQKTPWNPEGKVEYMIYEISGFLPKINGWQVVASCDQTIGGENLINVAPGMDHIDLSAYHTRKVCDHCGHNRKRNSTIILQHIETGALLQVGRNCAADFLRSSDINISLKFFESFNAYLKEPNMGSWKDYGCLLHSFFHLLIFTVKNYGYQSSKDCPEGVLATRDHILRMHQEDPTYWKYFKRPTEADFSSPEVIQQVEDMIAYAQNLEGSSEYCRTIRMLSSRDTIPTKYFGYMASIYVGWVRQLEEKVQKATQEPRKHYPADVGTMIKTGVLVEVVSCYAFDGHYGTLYILNFKTDKNESICWKSTSAEHFNPGEKLVLTRFKVKEHAEYKGQPQTVVSHVQYVVV